jgi:hypothetical protein
VNDIILISFSKPFRSLLCPLKNKCRYPKEWHLNNNKI